MGSFPIKRHFSSNEWISHKVVIILLRAPVLGWDFPLGDNFLCSSTFSFKEVDFSHKLSVT